jgi:hypothetical protein
VILECSSDVGEAALAFFSVLYRGREAGRRQRFKRCGGGAERKEKEEKEERGRLEKKETISLFPSAPLQLGLGGIRGMIQHLPGCFSSSPSSPPPSALFDNSALANDQLSRPDVLLLATYNTSA